MESLLRQEKVLVAARTARGVERGDRWRRRAWELSRDGEFQRALDLERALVSGSLRGVPRVRLRDRFRLLRLQLALRDWEGVLANVEVLYGRLARRGILGGVAAGWVFWARATAQFHLGHGARFRRTLATLLRASRRGRSAALRAAAFRLAAAEALLAADPERPPSGRVVAAERRALRSDAVLPSAGASARRRRTTLRWGDVLGSVPRPGEIAARTPGNAPIHRSPPTAPVLDSRSRPDPPTLPEILALARTAQMQVAGMEPSERKDLYEHVARLAGRVQEPWLKASLLEALAEVSLWTSEADGTSRDSLRYTQARLDLGLAAGLFRRVGWTRRAEGCERRWALLALPLFAGSVAERVASAVPESAGAEGAGREGDGRLVAVLGGRAATPAALCGGRLHPSRVRAALQEVGFLTEDRRFLQELTPLLLLASSAVPVLITGESGTGKEVIARAVHRWSRLRGQFVPIHCGAIPRDLLESELFGHARGAFTGAAGEKPGLIEAADDGTLFLDEIGEMGGEAQMKMLRVLENGEVRRLGDLAARRATIRLVAATHRDLRDEIVRGRFRLDLYHRIRGVVVRLRPLRERRGDIPLLAARFLGQGGRPLGLSSDAVASLLSHSWPGNVRELRATLTQAACLARAIGLDTVPAEFLGLSSGEGLGPPALWERTSPCTADGRVAWLDQGPSVDGGPFERDAASPNGTELGRGLSPEEERLPPGLGGTDELEPSGDLPPGGLEAHLETIERRYILRALEAHGWNRTRAARSLGDMSRTTLLSKMKRLGIATPEGEDDVAPLEDRSCRGAT